MYRSRSPSITSRTSPKKSPREWTRRSHRAAGRTALLFGYLNDKNTRSLAVDGATAPLIAHAFRRYASRTISLSDLADELLGMGLRSRSGERIRPSALHVILRNPICKGDIRYKGGIYPGSHEPAMNQRSHVYYRLPLHARQRP